MLNRDMVEVVDEYRDGKLVRKTINGVEVPLDLDIIPDVVISRRTMKLSEAREMYGNIDA